MTGTPFTIADPNDAGMLDVVGFDSSAPAIMSDFIRKPFRSK
jgi:60 kDa SS-A/Ro ribonucleoprotein